MNDAFQNIAAQNRWDEQDVLEVLSDFITSQGLDAALAAFASAK
ncbi:MAG: hypothetical protein NTX33_04830 [Propionibacteriales bacterium]|nr:hypothetical protein [Propionibacteriales bacterium]